MEADNSRPTPYSKVPPEEQAKNLTSMEELGLIKVVRDANGDVVKIIQLVKS